MNWTNTTKCTSSMFSNIDILPISKTILYWFMNLEAI